MWLPDSIYRILPAAYAVTGVALVPLFGFSGPAVISSAMLLAAALLTTVWRYTHPERKTPSSAPTASDVRDEWAQRRLRREESMRAKQG
ncbi:MAG: hypothetical protein Q7U28_12195 [Aquabacterium sp.]|nr:hypothetical protein [Aquabacterium sp.]